MNKKIVLVLGATGNIGLYLVDWLATHLPQEEFSIVAVGHRDTNYFSRYGIPYISIDISVADEYKKLPQTNVFAAIDLANALPARMKEYNPAQYISVNTLGSLYLLEYLRKINADRILFTQTYADLAGHWGIEKILSNSLPQKLKYTGDHAVYAISKCAAVELMEHYYQEFGLANFIFRLPNIYMYSPEKYYFVDGKETRISYRYLIERAIQGLALEVWGNPDIKRDIVYIKDLCQMMEKALLVNKQECGTFNVGTGHGTTMLEQIEGIINVFCPVGQKSELIYCPQKRNSMEYIMDISEAREKLGYHPEYDYLSYLEDYKREMKSNRFWGNR